MVVPDSRWVAKARMVSPSAPRVSMMSSAAMRMNSRSRGWRLPGRRNAGAVVLTADDWDVMPLSIADRDTLPRN